MRDKIAGKDLGRGSIWSSQAPSEQLHDEVKSCRPINFTDSMTQPFHGSSPSLMAEEIPVA